MTARFPRGVGGGGHIVFIYGETPELDAFAVSFIKEGLAKSERCVYVLDDLDLLAVTEALAAGGVDVDREQRRGALVMVNTEEQAGPPPFDPLRVVEAIRGRAADAVSGGFAGLRVAGLMTWAIRANVQDRALIEFETLLEKAAGPHPLSVACMYRRDLFSPGVLRNIIRSHPTVVADDTVYLSLSELFQDLSRSELLELSSFARELLVPKGESYFRQGDRAPGVYVLTAGMVKLVRTDPDGRNVIIRIVKPMELFVGDTAVFEDPTHAASVSAVALDNSRALAWDAPKILEAMRTNPAISFNAVRTSGERIEEYVNRLQDLATSSVERRMARLLLRLARSVGRRTGHGVTIEVSLSGQDLAELVFTTPFTISRILADWRRLGLADAQRDRILLLDSDRIAAVARLESGKGSPR